MKKMTNRLKFHVPDVSLGRKVHKAPGRVSRSSFTWSHAKLVRSTQLFSKSWLGCNPLGRENLEFHSNSVLSQYTLHLREIQTIFIFRGIWTQINNFATKVIYLTKNPIWYFRVQFRKNLIMRQLPCVMELKRIETKVHESDSRQTVALGLESGIWRKSKKVEFGDKFETETDKKSFSFWVTDWLFERSGLWWSIYF